MEDTEKTEAKTEEQPEAQAEKQAVPAEAVSPVSVIAGLMSLHADFVGRQVCLSETLSPSDKVAMLRIAGFVLPQAYAMALTRIGGAEAAKPVPYLPLDVNSCMRTAEILSKAILGEAPKKEEEEEQQQHEPLIVVPGRENNRKARRTAAAKK